MTQGRSIAIRNGFTLIELLVVVVIIGIILGISSSQLSVTSRNMELGETRRQIVSAIGEVRQEAIRLRVPVTITFTSTGMQWDFLNVAGVDGSITMRSSITWAPPTIPSPITLTGFGLAPSLASPTMTYTLTNNIQTSSFTINRNGYIATP